MPCTPCTCRAARLLLLPTPTPVALPPLKPPLLNLPPLLAAAATPDLVKPAGWPHGCPFKPQCNQGLLGQELICAEPRWALATLACSSSSRTPAFATAVARSRARSTASPELPLPSPLLLAAAAALYKLQGAGYAHGCHLEPQTNPRPVQSGEAYLCRAKVGSGNADLHQQLLHIGLCCCSRPQPRLNRCLP